MWVTHERASDLQHLLFATTPVVAEARAHIGKIGENLVESFGCPRPPVFRQWLARRKGFCG
jgi:hypothetical protein